jgi:hypothetical protein
MFQAGDHTAALEKNKLSANPDLSENRFALNQPLQARMLTNSPGANLNSSADPQDKLHG